MKNSEKPWMKMHDNYSEIKYEFNGEDVLLLIQAKTDFEKLCEGWDLNNYLIWFITLEDKYISISFIPKIDTFVDGIPFQIANKDNYKYGRGYEFIYDANSRALLDTIGIR